MGYSHYWKFTGAKVTETDVVEVTILLKKCIEALDGKVLFPNWDENPTPTPFVLRGGDGTGEPVLNGKEIHFNGDASTDNACESFDLVPRNQKRPQHHGKLARWPYRSLQHQPFPFLQDRA